MENLMNEAREAMKKAGEKMKPAMEELREKAEPVVEEIREKTAPVAEKIMDGAELAMDRVKQVAKDVGARLENAVPGADRKNEFFDALHDEAVEMKEEARQKADELQKKLEALMHGDKEQ